VNQPAVAEVKPPIAAPANAARPEMTDASIVQHITIENKQLKVSPTT
jgi:hypothetical protein